MSENKEFTKARSGRISFSDPRKYKDDEDKDIINSRRLNNYDSCEFDGINCLKNLLSSMNKTFLDLENYLVVILEKTLTFEYDKEGIIALYNQVREEYIQHENYIYRIDIPHQSQTKALAYRLSIGRLGFVSYKRALIPVEYAFNMFLQNVNNFINNYIYINNNPELEDKIKQDIKEKFLIVKMYPI